MKFKNNRSAKIIKSPFAAYVQACKRKDSLAMTQELPFALRNATTTAKVVEWAAMYSPMALEHLVEMVPDRVVDHLPVAAQRAVESGNFSTLITLSSLLSEHPKALSYRIVTTRDPASQIKIALLSALNKKLSKTSHGGFMPIQKQKMETPTQPVLAPNPTWRRLFNHIASGKTDIKVSGMMGDVLLTWAPQEDRANIVAMGLVIVLKDAKTVSRGVERVLSRWASKVKVKDLSAALEEELSGAGNAKHKNQILESVHTLLNQITAKRYLTKMCSESWEQDSLNFDEEAIGVEPLVTKNKKK